MTLIGREMKSLCSGLNYYSLPLLARGRIGKIIQVPSGQIKLPHSVSDTCSNLAVNLHPKLPQVLH